MVTNKELKNLTIEEFMSIGKRYCNKSIYDHSPCKNTSCPFHDRWSCDVYDLLSHVQEEEFDKKYIVDLKEEDIAKNLNYVKQYAQTQYLDYCETLLHIQHQHIRSLIGLDSKPVSKAEKVKQMNMNVQRWREKMENIKEKNNDQTS